MNYQVEILMNRKKKKEILMNNLNYIGKGLKCIDNVFLAQFTKQD